MDGHAHLEGRPRYPLLPNLCLEVQKITTHAWLSPPYEETVLGPMSLKERGDRRRPRVTNVMRPAEIGNVAGERLEPAMSALGQKRTLRRLAGGFKLDIGNPVALAPAQAGLFILTLES